MSEKLLIRTIEAHKDIILSLAISPDGKFIASGFFDRTIKVWNLNFNFQKSDLITRDYEIFIKRDDPYVEWK